MSKAKRPTGLKKKGVAIPVELKEHDKAEILMDIVNLNVENEVKSEELSKLRAEHKDSEKELSAEITFNDEKIDAKIAIARRGYIEEDVECFERKNFDAEPPIMEHVDAKGVVLHSFPLRPDQLQTVLGEWNVGEPKEQPINEPAEAFEED